MSIVVTANNAQKRMLLQRNTTRYRNPGEMFGELFPPFIIDKRSLSKSKSEAESDPSGTKDESATTSSGKETNKGKDASPTIATKEPASGAAPEAGAQSGASNTTSPTVDEKKSVSPDADKKKDGNAFSNLMAQARRRSVQGVQAVTVAAAKQKSRSKEVSVAGVAVTKQNSKGRADPLLNMQMKNHRVSWGYKAVTDATFWKVHRESFLVCMQDAGRRVRELHLDALSRVALFGRFAPETLMKIAEIVEVKRYQPKETIMVKKHPNLYFSVLLSGTTEHATGEPQHSRVGDYWGESCLMSSAWRRSNNTIIAGATEGCTILRIERSNFVRTVGPIGEILSNKRGPTSTTHTNK